MVTGRSNGRQSDGSIKRRAGAAALAAARGSVHLVRDICLGTLDLIYPPFCLVCGEAGEDYLCPKCSEMIDVIEPPYCRKCGLPTESYFCSDCRDREFAFEYSVSVGTFDGPLRDAIHALKYGCHAPMAEPLGELMARRFPATGLLGKVGVAVPVPIHRSRMVQRGFNQAEELARVLCRRVGLPLENDLLRKARKTRHQVDLPQDERVTNMHGAFAAAAPERIAGRRMLLVDDVFTTGSTLDEAAKTLRAAGALEVYAYTLARSI